MDAQASTNGNTPLHNAISSGHLDVAEVITAIKSAAGCIDPRDSNWDVQNANGNTVLHVASAKGAWACE